MSMKRCFELPVPSSLSLLGRAVLMGGVLSLATACARKDAAKGDSASAVSDSAATTSTMTATPASPVESVSTGETTVSAESKANPTVAAENVASGTANTAATPAPATKTASPAHHAVHHTDSSAAKRTAETPAAAATTTRTAAADTGQKTAADTSKKTAAAGGAVDHLLVSPQEYEGWKMFSVYCYRCHGVDAMGGGIAPNLRHSVSSEGSVTHDIFIQTVTNGRLDKGMPSWKALLSPEQMEDLWLYVNARSSGRLNPGRPHMAQGANP
jgi:mono/diheme cytochrome c family protein